MYINRFLKLHASICSGFTQCLVMVHKPQLTSDQISFIYSLYKACYSLKEIVLEAKVPRSVACWVNKIRESGENIPPTHLKRPGRSKAVPIKTYKSPADSQPFMFSVKN